jgi:ATP-dependent DNA helicase PIF1
MKYWQSEEFPTVAVGQFPLTLAWAMTIHKIQGATLSMAEIDVGGGIFECGQTYVALSRVRDLDGLYLSKFDSTKIKSSLRVRKFYNSIPEVEYEVEEKDDYELGFEKFALHS